MTNKWFEGFFFGTTTLRNQRDNLLSININYFNVLDEKVEI